MKEVGDLREAKRALQQCVSGLSFLFLCAPLTQPPLSLHASTARSPTSSSSRPGMAPATA